MKIGFEQNRTERNGKKRNGTEDRTQHNQPQII